MDKSQLMQRMEAGEFSVNNGKVLRTINILEGMYSKLAAIKYALPDITESDIRKAVNFLEEEEYIRIREIENKTPASISDHNLNDLEAKPSGKGLRLLKGYICDECVQV